MTLSCFCNANLPDSPTLFDDDLLNSETVSVYAQMQDRSQLY